MCFEQNRGQKHVPARNAVGSGKQDAQCECREHQHSEKVRIHTKCRDYGKCYPAARLFDSTAPLNK